MAYNYNNGFPVSYQPMYYPQQQYQVPTQANTFSTPQNVGATQPQPMMQNNSIIWVQGEAGAKSYLVAPNTTVQLWDSENQVIYLKSADASGMPSIKTLDYSIRETKPVNVPSMNAQAEQMPAYATKEDLAALRSEVEAMLAKKEVEE